MANGDRNTYRFGNDAQLEVVIIEDNAVPPGDVFFMSYRYEDNLIFDADRTVAENPNAAIRIRRAFGLDD